MNGVKVKTRYDYIEYDAMNMDVVNFFLTCLALYISFLLLSADKEKSNAMMAMLLHISSLIKSYHPFFGSLIILCLASVQSRTSQSSPSRCPSV
jgi:hypothetical protein